MSRGRKRRWGKGKGGISFNYSTPTNLCSQPGSFFAYSLNKETLSLPPPIPVDLRGSQTAGRLNFLWDTFGIHWFSDLFEMMMIRTSEKRCHSLGCHL